MKLREYEKIIFRITLIANCVMIAWFAGLAVSSGGSIKLKLDECKKRDEDINRQIEYLTNWCEKHTEDMNYIIKYIVDRHEKENKDMSFKIKQMEEEISLLKSPKKRRR